MSAKRVFPAIVLLLATVLALGILAMFIQIRRFPAAPQVLPIVGSLLETNNYRLVLRTQNDIAHVRPPWYFRIYGLAASIRTSQSRLGGVGAPYEHGYLSQYTSNDHKELWVAIDICGGRAYEITLIGADPTLFRSFSEVIASLGVRVAAESSTK